MVLALAGDSTITRFLLIYNIVFDVLENRVKLLQNTALSSFLQAAKEKK